MDKMVFGFRNDVTSKVLNVVSVGNKDELVKEVPLHRHILIDDSYSMCSDLPRIRKQLKSALRQTVRVGDKVTLGWFSGRGQYGIAIEAFEVSNADHLKILDQKIDQYIRPVGATGFVEPLTMMANTAKMYSDDVHVLQFMTDGYDNCWNNSQIMDAIRNCGDLFQSITIVEYGWYANRNLLTQMAQEVGANYVFASDYEQYAPVLDDLITGSIEIAPRVEVAINGAIDNLIYSPVNGVTYSVHDGKVYVPENIGTIVYLSESGNTNRLISSEQEGYLYGLMGAYASRMKTDIVLELLKQTGDVRFINMFTNCFGKQSYVEFNNATSEAIHDVSKRFVDGCDYNLVPDENAFTVLDVIQTLISDEGNALLIGSDNFSYNRIGRAVVASESVDEVERLALLDALAKAKTASELTAISQKIADLGAESKSLKFVRTQEEVPFSTMVFNSSRPNVSGLFNISGYVEVGKNSLGIPEKVPTFIWRNYAIIRDGIVNMDILPMKLADETKAYLVENGVLVETVAGEDIVHLKGLPIVNRSMIRSVSAKALFERELDLMRLKGDAKVFKEYDKVLSPTDKSVGIIEQYGQEASDWLAERGVTDKGFSPKVVQAESTDVYIGKEIKVALKGLSSLPKVSDVEASIQAGKRLNVASSMMAPAVREYLAYNGSDKAGWVKAKSKAVVADTRKINLELAKIKFAVVVGQIWFPEFDSLDEGSLTIDFAGNSVVCNVSLKEIEVKI